MKLDLSKDFKDVSLTPREQEIVRVAVEIACNHFADLQRENEVLKQAINWPADQPFMIYTPAS